MLVLVGPTQSEVYGTMDDPRQAHARTAAWVVLSLLAAAACTNTAVTQTAGATGTSVPATEATR